MQTWLRSWALSDSTRTFKVYSENEMNKTGELCELAKGTRAGNKEALNS